MKKLFVSAIIAMFSVTGALAAVDTVETISSVKATVVNATSPWFAVPTDNIGIGLSVTAGSCNVELALEPFTVCNQGTATSFDWDVSPNVTSGNKKFNSFNGVSCVRVICTTGSGVLLIRRHQ
jgi:archaellin